MVWSEWSHFGTKGADMFTKFWRHKRVSRRMRLGRDHAAPNRAGGSDSTGGLAPRLRRRCGVSPPVALLAGLVIAGGVLTGCGSSDSSDASTGDKNHTSPSQTSEPKVSPAPEDAPDLDEDQKNAYKSAVRKYAEYQDFVDETNHEPKDTKENARRLVSLTIPPETEHFTTGFDELIDNDIRIEGSRKVEWSTPVKVTDDKVVFKQCESPGTWVAIQGDQKETEHANTVSKVTVVKRDDGKWYVKNNEVAGDC